MNTKKVDPVLYYQEQVDLWQSELEREDNQHNAHACRLLRDEAAQLNAQFQRILFAYLREGDGLTLRSGDNYCVVLPDASEVGRFRYQSFNSTGFIGHVTRDTAEEVLLEAFKDGFRDIADSDVINQFCQSQEWARGNVVNDLVRKVNRGDMTLEEANRQYEAALASIVSGDKATFLSTQ